MKMVTPLLTTEGIPYVLPFLSEKIPGILRNKCINYDNLPFRKEVLNTEVGHLFEHMVLEFLCQEKRLVGDRSAVYNGTTSWNWNKEKKGTFHISIGVGIEEKELVTLAIIRSIGLMNELLGSRRVINSAGSQNTDHPLHAEVSF